MDINNAASSRAAFYDRGAIAFTLGYAGNSVVPHGTTVRASYTVPVNRKAIVNGITVEMLRRTVGAPNDRTATLIQYSPGGVGGDTIFSKTIIMAAVGDMFSESISPSFVMYAGDILIISTSDLSTNGTVLYNTNCMISEFDF